MCKRKWIIIPLDFIKVMSCVLRGRNFLLSSNLFGTADPIVKASIVNDREIRSNEFESLFKICFFCTKDIDFFCTRLISCTRDTEFLYKRNQFLFTRDIDSLHKRDYFLYKTPNSCTIAINFFMQETDSSYEGLLSCTNDIDSLYKKHHLVQERHRFLVQESSSPQFNLASKSRHVYATSPSE